MRDVKKYELKFCVEVSELDSIQKIESMIFSTIETINDNFFAVNDIKLNEESLLNNEGKGFNLDLLNTLFEERKDDFYEKEK